MSTIEFPMLDRLVLTPMEINPVMKKYPWYAAGVLLLFGLQPSGVLFREAWSNGWPFLVFGLITVFAGAFLTPVFLPFVPFRSFAIKGWIMGMALCLLCRARFRPDRFRQQTACRRRPIFCSRRSARISRFSLRGATTYTGMSGVNKELKIGIPVYFGAAAVSLVLLVLFKLQEWRIL